MSNKKHVISGCKGAYDYAYGGSTLIVKDLDNPR